MHFYERIVELKNILVEIYVLSNRLKAEGKWEGRDI
jgi:hypothetical protein